MNTDRPAAKSLSRIHSRRFTIAYLLVYLPGSAAEKLIFRLKINNFLKIGQKKVT